jgi:hypothetical protein
MAQSPSAESTEHTAGVHKSPEIGDVPSYHDQQWHAR